MPQPNPTAWTLPADPPPGSSPTALLHFAVRAAILAPSSHNTQPWLFEIAGDSLLVRADRRRRLPVVDPDERELTISVGAATLVAEVALRHLGTEPVVETLPDPADPDLIARIRVGEPLGDEPPLENERLFTAIHRRRTNRMGFEDRAVPGDLVERLIGAARDAGADLVAITHPDRRAKLAALVAEGDRAQFEDKDFRRELAHWMRPPRAGDGIPGHGLGFPDMATNAASWVVRTFDMGHSRAQDDLGLAEGSPLLIVLRTASDSPADLVAAGRALARVLLKATAAGVSASYLNQPIEVPSLRPRLAGMLDGEGEPQLLLRLGYGPEIEPSPRRPLEDVLTG